MSWDKLRGNGSQRVCAGNSNRNGGRIILVAEDDILLLKRAFSKAGLVKAVVFVRDGEEVIKYLCRFPPFDNALLCPRAGLLLLDVRMPKLDGLQVLE